MACWITGSAQRNPAAMGTLSEQIDCDSAARLSAVSGLLSEDAGLTINVPGGGLQALRERAAGIYRYFPSASPSYPADGRPESGK